MMTTAALLALVIALEPQEPPTSSAPSYEGYVQGTVMLTSQPAGTANHRVSPPLGGRAAGIAAGAGIVLSPTVSLEGEVVLGGTVSMPQRFSYFTSEDYIADHRDLFLNANLRSRIGPSPVELVIGAGLAIARSRQLSRIATRPSGPGTVIETPLPDATVVERDLNIGGGIDIPIRLNPRVAFVPTFRYRFVPRRSDGIGDSMGVGRRVYEFGASVRSRIESRRPTSAALGNGYVQGSAFATVQPAGRADRVWPALSGRVAGIAAGGGRFVTRDVAVEGEFVLGRTVSLPQQFSYLWIEDYVAESRLHLVAGNVRWRPAGTSPVEFVMGGGLATSRIRKRSVVATAHSGSLNMPPPVTPDRTDMDYVPHVGAGLDAPIAVNANVAVVPTFRVRCVAQKESGLAAELGVSRYSYQFGVSVRAGF